MTEKTDIPSDRCSANHSHQNPSYESICTISVMKIERTRHKTDVSLDKDYFRYTGLEVHFSSSLELPAFTRHRKVADTALTTSFHTTPTFKSRQSARRCFFLFCLYPPFIWFFTERYIHTRTDKCEPLFSRDCQRNVVSMQTRTRDMTLKGPAKLPYQSIQTPPRERWRVTDVPLLGSQREGCRTRPSEAETASRNCSRRPPWYVVAALLGVRAARLWMTVSPSTSTILSKMSNLSNIMWKHVLI